LFFLIVFFFLIIIIIIIFRSVDWLSFTSDVAYLLEIRYFWVWSPDRTVLQPPPS
jgi:hypothetical protein